jgi:CheY-like chemotaxis protein
MHRQDDFSLNLRLISRLLQLRGFDVTAVADGGAALNALLASFGATEAAAAGEVEASPQQQPFDLALLDMNMARSLPRPRSMLLRTARTPTTKPSLIAATPHARSQCCLGRRPPPRSASGRSARGLAPCAFPSLR